MQIKKFQIPLFSIRTYIYFFFFMILFACNSCTGGYIVIFTYVLKVYLSWI
jgi:hypothetical protein